MFVNDYSSAALPACRLTTTAPYYIIFSTMGADDIISGVYIHYGAMDYIICFMDGIAILFW